MSLVQALTKSAASLKEFVTQANAAGTAAKGIGDKARAGSGEMRQFQSAVEGSSSGARSLKTTTEEMEKSVGRAGKTGEKSGGLLSKFKLGADKARQGMDGMNKSMKGNLLGVLLGLLAPLIGMVVQMALQSKTMQNIMKKAFGVIKSAISGAMKIIGPVMKKAGALIKQVWNGIKSAITTVVKAVGTVIKTYFDLYKTVIETVLKVVRSVVKGAWNGIKAVIVPVIDWVKSAVPHAFQAVKDKLSSIWGGLEGIASRAFGGIKSAVVGPIDGVIGLINRAIGALNSVHVSIPGWVPLVGGKTFGVHLPTIPMLAAGGVVMPRAGGVPAILAEAGEAEAVLPLSKLSRLLGTATTAGRTAGGAAAGGSALHIENYYAASSGDAQSTADALMYLAKARG